MIRAKEELSFVPPHVIELDYTERHYRRELPRELFDRLITPIVDRTLGPCRAVHPRRGRGGGGHRRSGAGGRIDANSAGPQGRRSVVPRAARTRN